MAAKRREKKRGKEGRVFFFQKKESFGKKGRRGGSIFRVRRRKKGRGGK